MLHRFNEGLHTAAQLLGLRAWIAELQGDSDGHIDEVINVLSWLCSAVRDSGGKQLHVETREQLYVAASCWEELQKSQESASLYISILDSALRLIPPANHLAQPVTRALCTLCLAQQIEYCAKIWGRISCSFTRKLKRKNTRK
jgi:hypothetical protein